VPHPEQAHHKAYTALDMHVWPGINIAWFVPTG